MNKLFPIAVAILIMLGASLWLLAPSSFNQYLHAELQKELSLATGTHVDIGHVDSQSYSGTILSLSAKAQNGEQLFYVEKVTYAIDRKSYKKPPIKITHLVLQGVEVTNDPKLQSQVQLNLGNYQKGLTEDSMKPGLIVEELAITFHGLAQENATAKPLNSEGKAAKTLLVDIANFILSFAKAN